MLNKIKLLADIKDDSQDALLSLLIEQTMIKVQNYCNREDVPAGLEPVIIDMVVNQYNMRVSAASGGTVESIKRGDTEIKYGSTSSANNETDIITDYRAQLARFKKAKFI